MAQRKGKESKNPILQTLEMSSRLQDLYEYVAHRDLVFVEIPSSSFLVPKMEEEEVEDFSKTPIARFYRGVHPLVLYIDNRIAVPVNSSLLQPYYTYLRYLVSTQPAVWAYAVSLTSEEVKKLYRAVFGDGLPENLSEKLEDLIEELEEASLKPVQGGYKKFTETFVGSLRESLEGEGDIRSVYTKHVLIPTVRFFKDYFESAPAGEQASPPSANYPPVTVLSGHTGIAKSAIVKKLEDPTKLEHYVPVLFGGSGDDRVVILLRPKVFTYKIGSTRFSEFSQSMYAVRDVHNELAEFGKEGIENIQKLFHFNPILEPFFFSSDQFRFPFRSLLLKFVQRGVVALRDPRKLDREPRGHVGVPVYLSPNGPVRLDLPEALVSPDPIVKALATVVDFSRPAVLFLDELDRNDAQLVQMVVVTFFFARQSQGLTYYSAHLIGAWNRTAEDEKTFESSLYLTAKTADPSGFRLGEGATGRRFQSVYLSPTDPEVYGPVIEYLTERFQRRGNLVGVEKFLNSLAETKFEGPGGKTEYNLLYYLPHYSSDMSSEDFQQNLLKGFATFRSYERLLTYLSRKKEQQEKEGKVVPIYMPFVASMLGYLFPKSSVEAVGKIRTKFKKAFEQLIKENFGYDPYDPPETLGDIISPSSSRVLEEASVAGVPIALYGPPGLAKTYKAKELLRKLNEPAFERLKRDDDFFSSVVSFLRENGIVIPQGTSPEELAGILQRDLLMVLIGTERSFSPSTVTGGGAPMPLANHRVWAPFSAIYRKLIDGLSQKDPFFEQYKDLASVISVSLYGGEETIVKQHAADPKAQLLHQFLKRFPEFRAVLVFDEITRADFVTQGSFFDALSERIISGEQFDPEPYSRVQIVATGNFTSGALFATEVNQVDAALVARFANFFQMEPSQEEIFEYQDFLLQHIKKALGPEPYDQATFEELRHYLKSGEGEDKPDLADFGYLLKTLFTITTRRKVLEEMVSAIRMEMGEVEQPPYLPSFRELEKFISGRILPNWSPLYAFIPEFAGKDAASTSSEARNEVIRKFGVASETELSDLLRTFKESEYFEALVESLDPGEVLHRLTAVALSKGIVTPEVGFGYVAFIPYPDEKTFPRLNKFLKEKAPEIFEYRFAPLGKKFSQKKEDLVVFLGPDVEILEEEFATLLESQVYPLNPLDLDWSRFLGSYEGKERKEAEAELRRYIERMVLASTLPTVFTHASLVDTASKVLNDRIFLFPGTTLLVEEEGQLDDSKVAKKAKDLRNTVPEQKEYFLFHMFKLLHLFSKLKLSQIAKVDKEKKKEETIEDLVRKDVLVLRQLMEKEHGTNSLATYFDREKADITSETKKEVSVSSVAEAISKKFYMVLDRAIQERLGVSLDSLRTLYSLYKEEEDKVPQELKKAYEYAKVYFERPDLLEEAIGGFNPDTLPVRDTLLSEPKVEIMFQSDFVGESGLRANIIAELSSLVKSKFGLFKLSMTDCKMSVDPPATSLFPPLGIIVPGTPFEVAGLMTVPALPKEELGEGVVKISSDPAHVYLYQMREDGTYEAYGLSFGVPIEDISFRRELARKTDEILQFVCNTTLTFVNGAFLSFTTLCNYEADQSALQKDLKEVLEAEEFSEARKLAERDPEVQAFIGDLEVLAGVRKGFSVGGTSSSRKGAKTDVEISASEMRELRDMFNTAIAASSPEEFDKLGRALGLKAEDIFKRITRGADKIEELKARLFGGKTSEAYDDVQSLLGGFLSGMEDVPSEIGLEEPDMATTAKTTAVEPAEVEKGKKRKSIAYNTGFSTRLPLFLLTLLRRRLGR